MVRTDSYTLAGIRGFKTGLVIANKSAGVVNVTRHAWQRFCGRYYRPVDHKVSPADFFLAKLQTSFRNSSLIQLSERERTLHLLHNEVKEVTYFHDKDLDLVFIVRSEENKVLITVWER